MVFMDGEGGGIQEIKVTQEPGSLPTPSRVEGGGVAPTVRMGPKIGVEQGVGEGGGA